MEITCYIVDDEQYAVNTLTAYIEGATRWKLLGTSLSAIRAMKEIGELRPDFTFMDIDMSGLNGIELSALVAGQTTVIFTTAHVHYAVAAFELNAADYLVKPIALNRFLKAVKRAEEIIMPRSLQPAGIKEDHLFINPGKKGKLVKLSYQDIIYIEGLKNFVIFYTSNEKHVAYLTMQDVEKALPPAQFIRVQKSFIVNRGHIKMVEGHQLLLSNGTAITLGKLYKQTFMELIALTMISTRRK